MQFFVDKERTPIEDASRDWSEDAVLRRGAAIDRSRSSGPLVQAAADEVRLLRLRRVRRLLVAAAAEPEWYPAVVLGGDAGLRMGEIIGLEWDDIDYVAGNLTVRRSVWRGYVGASKGGRERTIPMTEQLSAALKAHRHLRSRRVFASGDGSVLTRNKMRSH